MEKTPCTVYIDEAGDLGAQRGTQWFVLAAVIVDKGNEPQIRQRMAAIKTRLNLRTIHFRHVKDFNKRGYIVRELSQEDFTCIYILFDTNKYDRAKLPTESIAYNYICRYLIERVTWFLRDTNREGDIVLSSRGTSRDQDLVNYIRAKLIPYDQNEVAVGFGKVESKSASSWDMLQLADVCATSMFYAHEVNGYGIVIPCYINRLAGKTYQHNGRMERYGIKYFNDNMKPAPGYLSSMRVCRYR